MSSFSLKVSYSLQRYRYLFIFFQHGGEPEERFLTCIFVREKKIRNSNFILDCGKSPHPLKYDQVLIHSEDWRLLVEDFFPVL